MDPYKFSGSVVTNASSVGECKDMPPVTPPHPTSAEVRQVQDDVRRLGAAFDEGLLPVMTELVGRQYRRSDPRRFESMQSQIHEFSAKLHLALDRNNNMVATLFAENIQLHDENEQLRANLVALGYSGKRPMFFSNIREAAAVFRAMWSIRGG